MQYHGFDFYVSHVSLDKASHFNFTCIIYVFILDISTGYKSMPRCQTKYKSLHEVFREEAAQTKTSVAQDLSVSITEVFLLDGTPCLRYRE